MQNLAALIMQMEKMESEVNTRLSQLQRRVVSGQARNGLISATGDIWFNIKSVHIDEDRFVQENHDLKDLETFIVEAVNNTILEARRVLKTEIGGVLGGQVPPEFANFFGRGGSGA